LYDAIVTFREAKKARDDFWRLGKFRHLLLENLRGSRPVILPPSEEYPRLRQYRGTGPRCDLVDAYKPYDAPGEVLLVLSLDYVHADVSTFDEAEGCPGAPVRATNADLLVPSWLLRDEPRAAEFDAWASSYAATQRTKAKADALDDIRRLISQHKLTAKDLRALTKEQG
jgi:hypothetical protein